MVDVETDTETDVEPAEDSMAAILEGAVDDLNRGPYGNKDWMCVIKPADQVEARPREWSCGTVVVK